MSKQPDTFTIKLPNKDSLLGTFICNDKEEVDIYFNDIKLGCNFVAKKKNKPKNGNSCEYFQDYTVITKDNDSCNFHLCKNISQNIIFDLIIKYYNEHIWPQVKCQDISKEDGFGAFCTYFCDLQINNWNVDMWKNNAITLIQRGKIV
tara:strand:+ start:260 stop:703 length:444 start_codon:yes stop_codon:yes gene_type:complete